MVERLVEAVVLALAVPDRDARPVRDLVQDFAQVDSAGLPVVEGTVHVEPVDPTDHLAQRAEAQLRHDFAQFLGHEEEVVDDVLGLTGEAFAQHRVLRRHAHRAGVEVALAHHDAAGGDQRRRGKAELVGAQQRADRDVASGTQSTVDLDSDTPAQAIQHQRLLRLGKTDFPRRAGVGERGQWRGAGAALETRDRHVIGTRLADAGRNRADADFGHQLHRDTGLGIDVLEIVDELRQILDRINVVMRRRRDQADAGRRAPHAGDVLVDLVAGKLATLARLGALRHLDLDVVGIDEILGGDAEAARRHLLDGRAHGIAVGQRLETIGLLTALAGVRLAADAVHGDGERGVGLAADRAEAHGAGREALDDGGSRFDFVDGNRLVRPLEVHQTADRQQPLALLVDAGGESLVLDRRVAAHGVLKAGDALRRPGVILPAQAERVVAAGVEHGAIDRIVAEGIAMAAHRLFGDLGPARTLDRGGSAGEILFDEARVQADRIEDLGATIGLVGRDAHLGHHFQEALANRLDEVLLHVVGLERQAVLHPHLLQRFEREVGVDRLGAIARQAAEMVDLARLASLDHKAGLGAQSAADQIVVHGGGREQRRDRHPLCRHGAIRQDQDVAVGQNGIGCFDADAVERLLEAAGALGRRPRRVDGGGAEGAVKQLLDRANLFQLGVGQHGLRHFQPLVGAGMAAEQVGTRADHGHQRHHQLLTDRIDRRVGDLGEILLEVVVEQLRLLREHGDRRVDAHRADRIVGFPGHRLEEELDVLLGVAEGLLAIEQSRRIVRGRRHRLVG